MKKVYMEAVSIAASSTTTTVTKARPDGQAILLETTSGAVVPVTSISGQTLTIATAPSSATNYIAVYEGF